MAFFFTSPFPFFLPRACDLSSLSREESFFSPFSIALGFATLRYWTSCRCVREGHSLIFLSSPSPACLWSRDPVLCRSPWWMRRPCSSTYCWQPLHNHYSSLLTPQDLSEECPFKKINKMWACECVWGCLCQCFMVKNKLQENLKFA